MAAMEQGMVLQTKLYVNMMQVEVLH